MSATLGSPSSISLENLIQVLPQTSLFATEQTAGTGWLLSPEPYPLSNSQWDVLNRLGSCLYRFSHALDKLSKTAQKEPELAWVLNLFEAGKPDTLLNFSRMNRFKSQVPLVIRPDLLVTESGFALCEIDAVPGGIGFITALNTAYQALGFDVVGKDPAGDFLNMLLAEAPNATIAVVVSDEAADYRLELAYLVDRIKAVYPAIYLVHPKQITLVQNQLGFLDEAGEFTPIQLIYRFFELFDLPNIPQIELIQYAVKKGLVTCTPPFKPHLEEKLVLALIHHPRLKAVWESLLSAEDLTLLKSLVPETWILDPAPIPSHAAVIPPLYFGEKQYWDFQHLGHLSQKQRELVIKPSGFSPLAWGSRGVTVGHDVSQEAWQQALNTAMGQFQQTPHLLQRFMKPIAEPYTYFHPTSKEVIQAEGRTRLCPYYFVTGESVALAGVLATTCPKDKKIIHGMQDGVMRSCQVLM